jgi:hypothetical protein
MPQVAEDIEGSSNTENTERPEPEEGQYSQYRDILYMICRDKWKGITLTIAIGLAALGLSVSSLIASWKAVALAEQQGASQRNTSTYTDVISGQLVVASDRLYLIMDELMMLTRVVLMQFCADHPVYYHEVSL